MDIGKILLEKEPFSDIMMGNAAVVRAMIEAGVEVVTTYPGSPTPEIAEAARAVLKYESPFYFEYSTNEKVAAEVAFGASLNGRLSVVFFKSVGLNVASDSVVQFSLLEPQGGLVIILGDDPGANSSQNEQDNRHFARMTNIPVLEPADPQQVYEMFIEAVEISVENKMPVFLRMTTHVCHAKSRVSFGDRTIVRSGRGPSFDPDFGEYIPLTSAVAPMKKRSILKLGKIRERSENSRFNYLTDRNASKGIIICGLPSLSLSDLLSEIEDKPDVLTIGMVWPLPLSFICDFCENHDEVLIIEELDDFIEKEVKAAAFDRGLKLKIIGKTEPDDFIGELNQQNLRHFINSKWPELGLKSPAVPLSALTEIKPRPAQLCPGCGHRSAFYAIKKALKEDDITVADIGCHTLGYMRPYEFGKVLLSMGHSNGTGAGLSLFNRTRRIVTILGDSTFFHAGLPGIINAVRNNHDITLIVMENGTTAMTGHQDHAGSKADSESGKKKISIKAVLEGLGVEAVYEVDTYSQSSLTKAVDDALAVKGFSVAIARHPCMLKFTRENRHRGITPDRQAGIDPAKCKNIEACIKVFGCPSFMVNKETGSISVNKELCIGDGSCVQVCPVSAIGIKKKNEAEHE
ncbi:MAG: thiamine pyrophosphate-dependent enzyme [Spirochaetales bacterium]|uniref:Indolepyruvate oxidoreductase subunit IorA n=1 Tax=Candidatus Thalassospirochaeta sargassi TaxID=3119039 RepID=A0AAJ1IFG2_9SPIO|nr:thiamine pyrophosphate-dependent enzyme [Spirochaetales bacterium]